MFKNIFGISYFYVKRTIATKAIVLCRVSKFILTEGLISSEQAELLIAQLTRLKQLNPVALIENLNNTTVDQTTYYERITNIVNASTELAAFQVNNSAGVEDTIAKSRAQGKPIYLKSYQIQTDESS